MKTREEVLAEERPAYDTLCWVPGVFTAPHFERHSDKAYLPEGALFPERSADLVECLPDLTDKEAKAIASLLQGRPSRCATTDKYTRVWFAARHMKLTPPSTVPRPCPIPKDAATLRYIHHQLKAPKAQRKTTSGCSRPDTWKGTKEFIFPWRPNHTESWDRAFLALPHTTRALIRKVYDNGKTKITRAELYEILQSLPEYKVHTGNAWNAFVRQRAELRRKGFIVDGRPKVILRRKTK